MDINQNTGKTRTDMYCHACSSSFVAIINFDLDGNHQIECPKCGHIHYRLVQHGRVTSERYHSDSRNVTHIAGTIRDLWKDQTVPISTATVKHFLREKWINRSDLDV